MIVSFLYFLGPGAVTYTVQKHYLHDVDREDSAVSAMISMIAYAACNMAVLAAFLQPSANRGDTFGEGSIPAWQEHPAYFVLSVILAVAFGCVPFARQKSSMHNQTKNMLHVATLAASIGILAFPLASQHAVQDMRISTMPFKINGAFYHASLPIYVSGGGVFYLLP